MTILKTTRTVTVTSNQLQEMILAQRKARDFLKNNNTDKAAMTLAFSSQASGILGLAFLAVAPVSIALGIISILTSVGADTRQKVIDNVADGYVQLLETRNTLTNLGAVKANITLTSDRVSLTDPVEFINNIRVNWMETADGTRIH